MWSLGFPSAVQSSVVSTLKGSENQHFINDSSLLSNVVIKGYLGYFFGKNNGLRQDGWPLVNRSHVVKFTIVGFLCCRKIPILVLFFVNEKR